MFGLVWLAGYRVACPGMKCRSSRVPGCEVMARYRYEGWLGLGRKVSQGGSVKGRIPAW